MIVGVVQACQLHIAEYPAHNVSPRRHSLKNESEYNKGYNLMQISGLGVLQFSLEGWFIINAAKHR